MENFSNSVLQDKNITITDQPVCYYPKIIRNYEIKGVEEFRCDRGCPKHCLCFDKDIVLIDPK